MEDVTYFNGAFIQEVFARYGKDDVEIYPCSHLQENTVHGYRIKHSKGFEVSVQFHPTAYCNNRNRMHEYLSYIQDDLVKRDEVSSPNPPYSGTATTAEIAVIVDGNMQEFEGGGTVEANKIPQDVFDLIDILIKIM